LALGGSRTTPNGHGNGFGPLGVALYRSTAKGQKKFNVFSFRFGPWEWQNHPQGPATPKGLGVAEATPSISFFFFFLLIYLNLILNFFLKNKNKIMQVGHVLFATSAFYGKNVKKLLHSNIFLSITN
jgi:hypothetical protein